MYKIISKSLCKYMLPFLIYSARNHFPLRLILQAENFTSSKVKSNVNAEKPSTSS